MNLIASEELTIGHFTKDVFSLSLIQPEMKPWHILDNLEQILSKLLDQVFSPNRDTDIFIHPDAVVENGAIIKGPVYISAGCFIAAGAYLRGGVFLAENVSIGPTCEVKSSLIFKGSSLAHFNFIGDSIICSGVNFEAGSHTANHWNERNDKTIYVATLQGSVSTGRVKMGAIIGDDSRIGCNSVLSPGTLLAPNTIVPRLTLVEQLC